MKIHRLDHIHVYCSDPDTSVRFYTDVFEAEMLGKAYGSDGGVRYFLRLGGLAFVLAPYPLRAEPNIPTVYRDGIYEHGYGVGHFGLHVDNVDEAVESVRQRGAKILAEPREFSGARFAYVAAPDGFIIELLEHANGLHFSERAHQHRGDRPTFPGLLSLSTAKSMALIHADVELSRRLLVIEKAMTVIFGYTIEHTSRSENEATIQLLGIRLFNAAASGMKLALSGYYQTAFQQARDIMESCSVAPCVKLLKLGCANGRPGS